MEKMNRFGPIQLLLMSLAVLSLSSHSPLSFTLTVVLPLQSLTARLSTLHILRFTTIL